MYNIRFKVSVHKRFRKLPVNIQKRLVGKLEFYLQQDNPLQFAEVLTNPRIGQFRFRVGDYRIVFDVEESNTIIILDVNHRKDIYR